MKSTIEQQRWVDDYLAGDSLHTIAKRYVVNFWRVRNAVLWNSDVAAHHLNIYAAYVERIKTAILANPKVTHTDLGISGKRFRAVRYALIVTKQVPNCTRYGRMITPQEENRIMQLVQTERNYRKFSQLAKTTGRTIYQQSLIAAQILGERALHYRSKMGLNLREVARQYGIQPTILRRFHQLGLYDLPFNDDTFAHLCKLGYAMYDSCNDIEKPYYEIAAYYRGLYRVKYISIKYTADITYVHPTTIGHTLRYNKIPMLSMHARARIQLFDRVAVAKYYGARYGKSVELQLMEYDNDFHWLKTPWYTW